MTSLDFATDLLKFYIINNLQLKMVYDLIFVSKYFNLYLNVVVVVITHFLSEIVPLAEMAGFTSFLPQFFALNLSTSLDLGHPPLN